MKHIFLQLAITTTILLLLTTTTTTAIRSDDTILDVYGDPLEPGKNYYLLPSSYESAGGFTWTRYPDSSPACPTFFVTQVKESLDFGEPIAIYPKDTSATEIKFSSDVRIEFPNFPPSGINCRRRYFKRLGMASYNSNYIVRVEPLTWFTIEDDAEGNYNINFCYGKTCGGLGLVQDVYGSVALGYNVTSTKPTSFVFEPSSWSSSLQKAQYDLIEVGSEFRMI